MWPHYDNDCLGQVSGIRVQLDNGITGFIPCRFIDRPMEPTFEKALPGSMLRGKILKIDINKFNVEISIRSSDLQVISSAYPLICVLGVIMHDLFCFCRTGP